MSSGAPRGSIVILVVLVACDATRDAPAGVPDAAVSVVDTTADVPEETTPDVVASDAAGDAPSDPDAAGANDAPEVGPDEVTSGSECGASTPCDPGLVCVEGECVCDDKPVSFAADVRPLFTTGCGPGCHVYSTASSGSAGLNLHASHAHADLVGVAAFQCSGDAARARVEPGDVGASYLMDKLIGRDMCRGIRMPKGRSAWAADKLAVVGRWICQGARDD